MFADTLISIIIPSRNDGSAVEELLTTLPAEAEVIVVESGHVVYQERPHVKFLYVREQNRAAQMNAGARVARGQILFFLHADTRIEAHAFLEAAYRLTADTNLVGGYFQFRLDTPALSARLIELGVVIRERVTNLVYGDQCFFVRRDIFDRIGGFPKCALLEDVLFFRSLHRAGRVFRANAAAITSPRCYERCGYLRTACTNFCTIVAFFLGFSPQTLRHFRTWCLYGAKTPDGEAGVTTSAPPSVTLG